MSLPEGLGGLPSLTNLSISDCKSIDTLPKSIQQLTCLASLVISECPKLAQWCKSKENKIKLAHIKEILVDWKSIIVNSETDEEWSEDEDLESHQEET
ncbi:unnamed protein product [Urochloa humidicola]